MRKLALALFASVAWATAASAQVAPCTGLGGVNNVPIPGYVCEAEGNVPTYAAASVNLAPATTATDIACLTGSATRTVRIKRIIISGVAGTAINVPIFIAKRTTVDTGGTQPTTIAAGLPVSFPLDSAFAAATATLQAYTANPTINDTNWSTTLANIISAPTVSFAATGTLIGQQATVMEFWPDPAVTPPVLRGVTQQICISMNTSGQTVSTPSGGLVSVTWLWTELPF